MTSMGNKLEYTDLKSDAGEKTGVALLSVIYLFTFGAAEYITYFVNVTSGIIFHFIILLSLFVCSSAIKTSGKPRFWLALGLVPFMRIASLVMPTNDTSEIFWYILTAIPVSAAIIALVRNLKISTEDIGLDFRKPVIQILVALNGLGLGFIDYLFLKPDALNNQLTITMTLFPALILLVFTGFMEEIAFRGVLQHEASKLGTWGWVFVASIYTVMQIGQGSPWHSLLTLGIALFFGWIVKKTGSIWGVSLAHGLLNIGLFLVFPHLF